MIGRQPPLNACRAFKAAARLGSFSRAAEELESAIRGNAGVVAETMMGVSGVAADED